MCVCVTHNRNCIHFLTVLSENFCCFYFFACSILSIQTAKARKTTQAILDKQCLSQCCVIPHTDSTFRNAESACSLCPTYNSVFGSHMFQSWSRLATNFIYFRFMYLAVCQQFYGACLSRCLVSFINKPLCTHWLSTSIAVWMCLQWAASMCHLSANEWRHLLIFI